MKTYALFLFFLAFIVLFIQSTATAQQEDAWSDPFLVSDTLTDNRNITVGNVGFYGGEDFYAFWEKKIDANTIAIYSRKIYDLDDPVEVLHTPGVKYSNPRVITSYPGLDTSWVFLYHTDESGDLDIFYRFYTEGQFSDPYPLSVEVGDDEHLRVNEFRYMVWERNDSILFTRLLENNQFDPVEVVDTGNCANPVILKSLDWSVGKDLAWEKTVNDSTQIYLKEYDIGNQQWNDPIVISDSGNNTSLQFATSLYGMNPSILTWDHENSSGHTVHIYDPYEEQLYQFDFYQEQLTHPAIFTFLIPVHDWLDGAFPSFIKHDTGYVNVMAHDYGFFSTQLSEYISLTADTLSKYNIRMFQGNIYGVCYHDVINTWEVEKGGHRQIWASIYDLCLWGGVDETEQNSLRLSLAPNPAADFVNISCEVPANSMVLIHIYSSSGQLVHQSDHAAGVGGSFSFKWEIDRDVIHSGVYLVKVISAGFSGSGKVVVQ